MCTKKILLLWSILLVILLSCRLVSSTALTPATETPTFDPGPGQTQTAQVNAQALAEAQETSSAQSTAEAQLTIDAGQTATVNYEETKSAEDTLATATQVQAAKQTRAADLERKQEGTAQVIRQITAQAQDMADRIGPLYDQGIISSQRGTYHPLEDFDESWAQINWFQWWNTDYEPENFVIRADLFYSSASEKVNWFNSGCGFVFGLIDNDNFHVAQLSLDGYVNLKYWAGGDGNWIAKRPTRKLALPSGEAEIMMVVSDKRVTVYVDGDESLSEYASRLKTGKLAFTLGSGTNIGYGTRCKMTDVDLWIIE